MVETQDSLRPVEAPGISVALERGMRAASLRHFGSDGPFARGVQAALGMPLPERLRATDGARSAGSAPVILAWRSPTEALLLCADDAPLRLLESGVASCRDGCVVDQSGGLWILRACGERVAALFARIGGQGVLPALGGAHRGRLADIAVLAIQVRRDATLLVVERAYAEHLMNWIRTCATDLEAASMEAP